MPWETREYLISQVRISFKVLAGIELLIILYNTDNSGPTTSPFSFFVGQNLNPSLNPWFFRLTNSLGELLFDSESFNVVSGPGSLDVSSPSPATSTPPSALITTQEALTSNIAASVPAAASASSPASGCSQCSIFFEYVEVYYWPTGTANTDCLSAVSSQPIATMPPDLNPYYILIAFARMKSS